MLKNPAQIHQVLGRTRSEKNIFVRLFIYNVTYGQAFRPSPLGIQYEVEGRRQHLMSGFLELISEQL